MKCEERNEKESRQPKKNRKRKKMSELINKLKDKNYVRAFGLMTPEEQECFNEIGMKNCEIYRYSKWNQAVHNIFHTDSTYRIKPDYQPEPEFVDLEIVEYVEWLGVWNTPESLFLPHQFTHIHGIPSMPNFEGFWVNTKSTPASIDYISQIRHSGKKVFARFRKA